MKVVKGSKLNQGRNYYQHDKDYMEMEWQQFSLACRIPAASIPRNTKGYRLCYTQLPVNPYMEYANIHKNKWNHTLDNSL